LVSEGKKKKVGPCGRDLRRGDFRVGGGGGINTKTAAPHGWGWEKAGEDLGR